MVERKKVANPSDKNSINTDEVFMTIPIDDDFYLKFSEENGRSKMSICDFKSDVDVTYSLTGNADLFPNLSNISAVKELIELRKKLF